MYIHIYICICTHVYVHQCCNNVNRCDVVLLSTSTICTPNYNDSHCCTLMLCICVYIHICVYMCVYVYIHMYIGYIKIYTYVYVYTYVYMYICICNTLYHTAAHYDILQRAATHCTALQHTATCCNTSILHHQSTIAVTDAQVCQCVAV